MIVDARRGQALGNYGYAASGSAGSTPGRRRMDKDLDIPALRKLIAEATPEPWSIVEEWEDEYADDKKWRRINSDRDTSTEASICEVGDWNHDGAADAAFICAARTALPAALVEIERLREENDHERDHSKMLSEANSALYVEKRAVEDFCAKVRGEYTAATAERDTLRARVATLEAENARLKGKPIVDNDDDEDVVL